MKFRLENILRIRRREADEAMALLALARSRERQSRSAAVEAVADLSDFENLLGMEFVSSSNPHSIGAFAKFLQKRRLEALGRISDLAKAMRTAGKAAEEYTVRKRPVGGLEKLGEKFRLEKVRRIDKLQEEEADEHGRRMSNA
jgi:hypothetical protein